MDFGVVFNPFAGRGKAREFREYLKERLLKSGKKFLWVETKKADDGKLITDFFIKKGIKKILVCGGDGTINECVSSVALKDNVEHELYFLPLGIGNDLVRSLKLPQAPEESLEIFLSEKFSSKFVDCGKINEKIFVNNCGVGFDGAVTRLAEKLRNSKDPYTKAALRKIMFYGGFKAKVRIDGKLKVNGNLLLLVVSNGEFYGRGIKITPGAKLDDGYFNILIVENLPFFKRIPLFNAVKKGKHSGRKEFKFFKGKTVEVDLFDPSVDCHTDGLYLTLSDLSKIELLHKKVKIAYSIKGD